MTHTHSDETALLQQGYQALFTGDIAEAEKILMALPVSVLSDTLRGQLHAAQKKHAEAIVIFKKLTENDPCEPAHWVNLGCTYLNTGAYSDARAALYAAVVLEPDDFSILLNYGIILFRCQDWSLASEVLRHALRVNPQSAIVRIYLARCCLMQGFNGMAEELIHCEWDMIQIPLAERNELALAFAGIQKPDIAEQIFRAILKEHPDYIDAVLNLAELLERKNQLSEAQTLLTGIAPELQHDPAWQLQQVKLQLRADPEQAVARLNSIITQTLTAKQKTDAFFMLGKGLDAQGEYAKALQAFIQANAAARAEHQASASAVRAESDTADWLIDHPEQDPTTKARTAGASPAYYEAPVFLVGFPRSGTTLLEQMLDAHPDVQTLEEKPIIETVLHFLKNQGFYNAKNTYNWRADDIEKARALYWREVSRFVSLKNPKVFIDKNPLNISRLQEILTIFPNARFIFAQRHPCDVVLSCFMQNFRFTDSTKGFWSIAESAVIYNEIITKWNAQRQRLKPLVIDVVYEQMVDDPAEVIARVLAFLSLPWHDAVLDYAANAARKMINTPSYSQVVRPIYRHAINRWKNYEDAFLQSMAILQPHIKKMNYE